MFGTPRRFATAFVAAAFLLLGVAPLRAQEPINPVCPVMEEPVDPEFTVEYQGATIGLCCESCIERFQANPERYLADLPEWAAWQAGQQAAAADTQSPPVDESAIDPNAEKPIGFQLGKLHPVLVHFPIALLLFAAFGELLAVCGAQRAAAGARFALWLAVAGGGAAVLTGLQREESLQFGDALHATVELHETMAFVTLGAAFAALVLLEIGRRRETRWLTPAYRGVLWAAAGAVAYTGSLGGTLVFGADYLPF